MFSYDPSSRNSRRGFGPSGPFVQRLASVMTSLTDQEVRAPEEPENPLGSDDLEPVDMEEGNTSPESQEDSLD